MISSGWVAPEAVSSIRHSPLLHRPPAYPPSSRCPSRVSFKRIDSYRSLDHPCIFRCIILDSIQNGSIPLISASQHLHMTYVVSQFWILSKGLIPPASSMHPRLVFLPCTYTLLAYLPGYRTLNLILWLHAASSRTSALSASLTWSLSKGLIPSPPSLALGLLIGCRNSLPCMWLPCCTIAHSRLPSHSFFFYFFK